MPEKPENDNGRPGLLQFLVEPARAALEAGSVALKKPQLTGPDTGNPGIVIVIPGFTTNDSATIVLRKMLDSAGYDVNCWNQGFNLGIRKKLFDGLVDEFDRLHAHHNCKIGIVGQSLGGIYARELAKLRPLQSNHVITLGTPINHSEGSESRVAGLYKLLNLHQLRSGQIEHAFDHWNIAEAPPVPTTAIYSITDGICHWRTCIQHGDHPHVENLEVPGSHLGMGLNGDILTAISQRLSALKP
ncbi:MAG: alpha/beta hydrolase [Woeseiaceae bacterium]|nr:alpha/beta hydrolase [Woeseiaceae bacterium]